MANDIDGNVFKIKIQKDRIAYFDLKGFRNQIKNSNGFVGYISFHSLDKDIYEAKLKIYKWWLNLLAENEGSNPMDLDYKFRKLFLLPNRTVKGDRIIESVATLDNLTYHEFKNYMRFILIHAYKDMNIDFELPCADLFT